MIPPHPTATATPTATPSAQVVVIFEVKPTAAGKARYLQIASELRDLIMQTPGIVSFERFTSLSNEGKMLSLSYWADEPSVQQWRNTMAHRMAQQAGFAELFAEYRIRVAHIARDYSMTERGEAPADSNAFLLDQA